MPYKPSARDLHLTILTLPSSFDAMHFVSMTQQLTLSVNNQNDWKNIFYSNFCSYMIQEERIANDCQCGCIIEIKRYKPANDENMVCGLGKK